MISSLMSTLSTAKTTVHTTLSALWGQAALWGGVRELQEFYEDESAMSTVEYAIGTLGAAAFGAVLIGVAKSQAVRDGLIGIIQQALSVG